LEIFAKKVIGFYAGNSGVEHCCPHPLEELSWNGNI
jgi:hypothetical protein